MNAQELYALELIIGVCLPLALVGMVLLLLGMAAWFWLSDRFWPKSSHAPSHAGPR